MARDAQLSKPSGQFAIAVATGAVAAGAGADSEIFQFRWTSTTSLAVIEEIAITGMRATTAFAAGAIDIKATRATSWTAAGTGGTSLTLTTPFAKLRTGMVATLASDIRIATTAALGAGTKTLDTIDLGNVITHSSGGVGSATPIIGSIYLPRTVLFDADAASGESRLVLLANEGFVVRATVPGTGVWNLGLHVKWSESFNQFY